MNDSYLFYQGSWDDLMQGAYMMLLLKTCSIKDPRCAAFYAMVYKVDGLLLIRFDLYENFLDLPYCLILAFVGIIGWRWTMSRSSKNDRIL